MLIADLVTSSNDLRIVDCGPPAMLTSNIQHSASNNQHFFRVSPRPGEPAAHVRICLALLPSGPDAVRRLKLHRDRAAVWLGAVRTAASERAATIIKCTRRPAHRQAP